MVTALRRIDASDLLRFSLDRFLALWNNRHSDQVCATDKEGAYASTVLVIIATVRSFVRRVARRTYPIRRICHA